MEKKFYKFENLKGNWFIVEFERSNPDTTFTFCGTVVAGDESFWPIGYYGKDWIFDQFEKCSDPAEESKKLHPHLHREAIIAWANGEQIEYYDPYLKKWCDAGIPSWDADIKYRVKPKETTIVKTFFAYPAGFDECNEEPNLKLVFDFDTHVLLSAEVIQK